MTSAKKRMKKGRRSIDDTMRLNNPYSRSKSNVQRANLQSSILQASQEAPCVIPTKRRMSKDGGLHAVPLK
ncbi:hypothetical protein EON65_08085 [archaeon]|nr:MAG: hypothetical protein EON65_08085 [archaeon]